MIKRLANPCLLLTLGVLSWYPILNDLSSGYQS